MFIECTNLSKRYLSASVDYLLHHAKSNGKDDFWALKDIGFRIDEGERVGIIGRNGAGKSTLLNILSGYSRATSGSLTVSGKVTPIMEIGSSINPEETGRENIWAAGRLFRVPEDQLTKRVQEAIDFVDLGEYIDQPMKIYSSGMIAKVAFSCVLFTQPEILVIDEVLGVGDAEFKQKSEAKTKELCEKGKILLMVSHSMNTIRKYTERCIWLDQGKIKMDGPTDVVSVAFESSIKDEQEHQLQKQMQLATMNSTFGQIISIDQLQIEKEADDADTVIKIHQPVKISAMITAAQALEGIDLCLECYSVRGYLLMKSSYFERTKKKLELVAGGCLQTEMRLSDCNFNTGMYQIVLSVFQNRQMLAKRAALFHVENDRYYNYMDHPQVYYKNRLKLKKLHREENL